MKNKLYSEAFLSFPKCLALNSKALPTKQIKGEKNIKCILGPLCTDLVLWV